MITITEINDVIQITIHTFVFRYFRSEVHWNGSDGREILFHCRTERNPVLMVCKIQLKSIGEAYFDQSLSISEFLDMFREKDATLAKAALFWTKS